jgi:predicted house-cleaning noncanonical NTP pyrophosphatase (MazG superfamily)
MVEALPTKIERKLKALEEVAGLLNDLSPEELRAFLELTQRRPLFGGRASD